ncbi:AsmA-like protein [Chelatococcus asaccharovorans]|uniref:AsmA-like protein n=2 Tax=Chelatococcus asaccharovorans TaxID=28210 RepID=A0A2V3UBJ2_9HYPH|nr:AsmA-like protein [Chelatococcus asaccharovorans]
MAAYRKMKPRRRVHKVIRKRPFRILRGATVCVAASILLLTCVVILRVALGPIFIGDAARPIAADMAERLGPGWKVDLADAALTFTRHGPTLRVDRIDVRDPRGLSLLKAQEAEIAVSPWALLRGEITPRSVELSGLDLRLFVARDGGLALTAGEADPPEVTAPAQPSTDVQSDPATTTGAVPDKRSLPLAVGAVSFIDLVSGGDSAVAGVQRVHLSGAKLTLIDDTRRQRITFDDLSFNVLRPAPGELHFAFGLRGEHGPWQVSGTVIGAASGTERRVSMTVDGVPVSDLLSLNGIRTPLVTTDMPLSGKLDLTVAADDSLSAFDATLRGGRGVVVMDDPDQPPVTVDSIAVSSTWDAASGEMIITSADLRAGPSRFSMSGRLTPEEGDRLWRMKLAGSGAEIESLTDGQSPMPINDIALDLTGAVGGGVNFEEVRVSGADYDISLTGSLGTVADQGGVSLDISIPKAPARAVLRFWPAFVASDVRRYLVDNLTDGTVEGMSLKTSLTSDELLASRNKQPVPDETLDLTFAVKDGTLRPADGLPVLTQVNASGVVTGLTTRIEVAQAEVKLPANRSLSLVDGVFAVADHRPPVFSSANFQLRGQADALIALLGSDALKGTVQIDIDPAKVRGQADIKVALGIPLGKDMSAADVTATATGSLTNLSVDGFSGKDKLESASLALNVDATAFTLKGTGQIAGLPATFDMRQLLRSNAGEATISLVLDDAARARKGFDLKNKLRGPVAVKLVKSLDAKVPTAVDVDLQRASIDDLLPGWRKAAGRPGRLTLALVDGEGYDLRDIALDAGAVAKGTAKFAADGTLREASFSQFKLSPGDDLRLDVSRNRNAYRLTVKGNVLDARPFLAMLSDGSGGGAAADIDLDLAVNILAGYNDEVISNANLKLGRRGKTISDLTLKGRLGSAPISGQLGNKGAIFVETGNAGSALRFVDLYKRMAGGSAHLTLTPAGDDLQNGDLTIWDFRIRNDQGLQRIIAETPKQGRTGNVAVDPSDISFTKLKVNFTRATGRINIREGVVWGPTVGVSLEGHLDTARDRLDLSGTYVPAYALNNIFSQVPIVGLILGGGQYEGLFAVNFRVTGTTAAPVMSINPLSAVAPGIFRKFFDLGRADSGRVETLPPSGVPER